MSSKAERKFSLGIESTPGTAVSVDYTPRATAQLKPAVTKIQPDEDIGAYLARRTVLPAQHAEGTIEVPAMCYEECPHWLSLALGSVTPSGASDPYTWTLDLPYERADLYSIVTATMELTDGSARHITRGAGMVITELEITGNAGEAWQMKAAVMGGAVTRPSALSGNIDPLSPVTSILMADTDLYIDTLYTNIGTTPFTQLISFSYKLSDFRHTKQFSGSLYPTGYGTARYKVELKLVVEVENAVSESELDKILNTTQSAIRIEAAASANDSLTIDGLYSLMEHGTLDDRDGNNTIELTYANESDANEVSGGFVVVTNRATI